jgi:hypothetical protein
MGVWVEVDKAVGVNAAAREASASGMRQPASSIGTSADNIHAGIHPGRNELDTG